MQRKKSLFLTTFGGLFLILGLLLWVTAVQAQCGSQTSTCKNCHEVQGQDPVNNDGTAWHQSHAFGDFCYLCHAGNQQATDKATAHQGMVPPLSDIQASCASCHPNDTEQRAEVYAKVLGVTVGYGSANSALATLATTPIGTESAASQQAAAVAPTPDQSSVCAASNTLLSVDDPNVVDYTQLYNQVVLGQHPVNWGNIALVGLIGLVVLGGGGFMIFNEVKLHRASEVAIQGEYPEDVVELLPALTNLKAKSRKSLKNILDNPEKSDKVLGLIDEVVSDDKPEEKS